MKQFDVQGMHCAACQARVEKAVAKVDGVEACAVNLLTNSMGVEGTASDKDIIKAVKDAGYKARVKTDDAINDADTGALRRRLVASVAVLLVLMYFSMGHMLFGFPVPGWMDHKILGVVQLLLSAAILIINRNFFVSGIKGIIHLAPNMDTLIAMGSGTAFGYSTVMLIKLITTGDMKYMDEFYFESAAMILTLITVGKMLEASSKGRTTNAIKSLIKLSPDTANVIRDNEEITIPAREIKAGDIFVVRPGEKIPVDGTILEGNTAIDESALTGESIPCDKKEGDEVYTATINKAGFIRCEATRVGKDTTLARIIKTVEESAATKAPIAKLADKISGVFVPAVIAIAVITFIIWQIVKGDTGFALARAICVLVISCPCALGLATPVAIMVGNGVGAKKNILFKTSEAMQETGKIRIVALDKTGTVTEGRPKVTDVEGDREEVLRIAGALEAKSEHPISVAIMEYIKENKIACPEVKDFRSITGSGVEGTIDGIKVEAGRAEADRYAKEGKTPIAVKKDGETIGIIAVADTIKPDSREAIKELKKLNIRTVMLTGDNRLTAEAIAREAGIDEVIAEVRPEGKEEAIRKLKSEGKTAMVGDGINDAPALTTADIGIAIGAGTDIAIDAADVVLMRSSIKDVVTAIKLSRKTYTNIKENLFWALIYNVVLIPLAAGVYGLAMDPMYGAAAMSLSSFFVVTNALRLNRFKE